MTSYKNPSAEKSSFSTFIKGGLVLVLALMLFLPTYALSAQPFAGAGNGSLSSLAGVSPSLSLENTAHFDAGSDIAPSIATDGKKTLVSVWTSNESTFNLGYPFTTDFDVFYSVSRDGGRNWSDKQSLVAVPSDSYFQGVDYNPSIATDGKGNWAVVWAGQNTLNNTIGTDLDIFVVTSHDNALTWSAPIALNGNASTDTSQDKSPVIETDGRGNWVTVWYGNNPLNSSIFDVYVSRSENNGDSWSPVETVNDVSNDVAFELSYFPKIATNGRAWIVTYAHTCNPGFCPSSPLGFGKTVVYSRSLDHGKTWSVPQHLNNSINPLPFIPNEGLFYSVQPSTASNGNWVGIFSSNGGLNGQSGGDDDILVVHSTDNGFTWDAPTLLNTNALSDTGYDYVNDLSSDGKGNVLAVWNSNNGLGAIGGDNDIHYAYSKDNGYTWTAPTIFNSFASVDNPAGGVTVDQDYDARLVNTGKGTWLGVWSSTYANGDLGTDSDILKAFLKVG